MESMSPLETKTKIKFYLHILSPHLTKVGEYTLYIVN